MTNDPVCPDGENDTPEMTQPEQDVADAGMVELYWNRPPAPVRRDGGHVPPAGETGESGGPHLRPKRKRAADFSDLWIDLGAGG